MYKLCNTCIKSEIHVYAPKYRDKIRNTIINSVVQVEDP